MKMNKLTRAKLTVFFGILLMASISYAFHLLPYRAVWLWFPILVFVNRWLDWYAMKKGMVLSDEMTMQRTWVSAWKTFQGTIAVIFLTIVYYDTYRTSMDPRFILAYLAGFMGIAYIAVFVYYSIKQGMWEMD
jgi:uncharacterized membrane protein HdeD (DUF308 family)